MNRSKRKAKAKAAEEWLSSCSSSRRRTLFILAFLVLPLFALLLPLSEVQQANISSSMQHVRTQEQLVVMKRAREQATLSNKSACPSLYRKGGSNNEHSEHSPMIFERHNVMVCRTPKVGSVELRLIENAYHAQSNFSKFPKHGRRSALEPAGLLLGHVKNESTFKHYLHDNDVTRIMWVRHPVRRILSGFIEITRASSLSALFWTKLYGFDHDLGFGPAAFETWLTNSSFLTKEYNPSCNSTNMDQIMTNLSQNSFKQHWAPAQHCRCGISDCGVVWNIFKIEEHPAAPVLEQYIPGPWLPPATQKRIHTHFYNESEYLTPKVLEILNHATRVEIEIFGYEPL